MPPPTWTSLHLPPHPTPLGCYRAPVWNPWGIQQIPLAIYLVVQSLSCVWLFETPWTAACQTSLSFTISWSLLKVMSIESGMPSSHLVLCHPPLEWVLFSHQVPKYWSFSFNISPSNDYSGLISFKIDWFDLLANQGTLKSLLQHHSSKELILQCLAFFMVQLSHPYMTTVKTITLTLFTFVGKLLSLLFNYAV